MNLSLLRIIPHLRSNLKNLLALYSTMNRQTVYVTRALTKGPLEALKESCEVTIWDSDDPVPRQELLKNVPGKDALFCLLTDKIDKELLDAAGSKLKVIGTMSVGLDHLDLEEIHNRNIKIGYTPDVLTESTAELTVALLLATSRMLLTANKEAKTGGWSSWKPFWMCGQGIINSTIGIVGFGRIGQEVARYLKPYKPKEIIFYNTSNRRDAAAKEIGARKVDLNELLQKSDFVIVLITLSKETYHFFNADKFKKMKKNAIFINVSRGDIVDQDALVKALQNGTISAAGLDVTTPEPLPVDHPLFKLENCVVLPHIGSATMGTRELMAMRTVQNIIKGLKGEEMPAQLKP